MSKTSKVIIKGRFIADIPASLVEAYNNEFGGRKITKKLLSEAKECYQLDLNTCDIKLFDALIISDHYISRADWVREKLRNHLQQIK